MIIKKLFFITFLILCSLDLFPQYKSFSGIHDTQFDYIDRKLEEFGFSKSTYYFDEINKKDGLWELFPKILISDSIFAVSISTIEGLVNQYSFVVLYDSKNEQVLDTIGPFYDSYVNAIKFKNENGITTHLTLRLYNPPEPYEPKLTFIQYERKNKRLVEIRRYDKD